LEDVEVIASRISQAALQASQQWS